MDKKLLGLIGVFLLVFGVFMSMLFFNNPQTSQRIRAEENVPSCGNSYIFADNLNAQIGSTVSLTVFVRNQDSNAVSNIPVTCQSTLGTLTPTQQTSSNNGSAVFTLTSQSAGLSQITCSVPSCGSVKNQLSVQFGN